MTEKISSQLEIGKCGEHLACFKLMKQGFTCYPSDQGLPYDIVVDVNGKLLRGQVKSSMTFGDKGKALSVYRFGTRTGRSSTSSCDISVCDFFAFVAIDKEIVAFMSVDELESSKNKGKIKQTVDFRTKDMVLDKFNSAKIMESYSNFNRVSKRLQNVK